MSSLSWFLFFTPWSRKLCPDFTFWSLYDAVQHDSLTKWVNVEINMAFFSLVFRFQVKKKQFFRNFMTITLFGAVGTLVSFVIISLGKLLIHSWSLDVISLTFVVNMVTLWGLPSFSDYLNSVRHFMIVSVVHYQIDITSNYNPYWKRTGKQYGHFRNQFSQIRNDWNVVLPLAYRF